MVVQSLVGGTLKFHVGETEIQLAAEEKVDLSFAFSEKELADCRAIRILLNKGYLKQIGRTPKVGLLIGPPRTSGVRMTYGEAHPYLKYAILRIVTRRVPYDQYERSDFSARRSLVRMSNDTEFLERVKREETNERIRAEAAKRLFDCRP